VVYNYGKTYYRKMWITFGKDFSLTIFGTVERTLFGSRQEV